MARSWSFGNAIRPAKVVRLGASGHILRGGFLLNAPEDVFDFLLREYAIAHALLDRQSTASAILGH